MVTRKMARFSAVALAGIITCVFATEARATSGGETPIGLPAAALTAPTSCTVVIGTRTLLVETVLGGDSLTFPNDVIGGTCPPGETCSEYNYRFTISPTTTASKSYYVSISSDTVIYEASPGAIFINDCIADKTPANGLFSCHHREAKFTSSANILNAKVVVSRAAPRVSTAGAVFGTQSGFCLIQGPGAPVSPFTPVTNTSNQTAAGGKCDVTVTNGVDGKPVKVETTTPGCVVAPQVDLFINGQLIQDTAGEPITYGTGTTTCYPTTPKRTCVCKNPSTPCPN